MATGNEHTFNQALQDVMEYTTDLSRGLPALSMQYLKEQLDHYNDLRLGRKHNRRINYKPPMHRHPDTIIIATEAVNKLLRAAQQIAPERLAGEQFQKILSIYNAANALKLLNRFLDKRQDPLIAYPRPDGLDLWSPHINPNYSKNLIYERKLQRLWIRMLHKKGLWRYTGRRAHRLLQDHKNLADLAGIYTFGRMLLEDEVKRIKADQMLAHGPENRDYYMIDEDDPANDRFKWVGSVRNNLLIVLEMMAQVAFTPRPSLAERFGSTSSSRPPPTEDQVLSQNLNDTKILDKMITTYDEILNEKSPLTRLIVDLLAKEDRFEKALATEHVEDKLINKQVVMHDEETYIGGVNIRTEGVYFFDEFQTSWDFVYEVLGNIALVNRQRRNFRLFRDWQPGFRPWSKMYQFYDSTIAGNKWMKRAIKGWNKTMKSKNDPGNNPLHQGPTGYKNIGGKLFGITPVDYTPKRAGVSHFAACGVCHQLFVGGDTMDSTVVQLACRIDHIFHLKCIFRYWDAPGKYLFTCPTCKHAPALNFQNIGIIPDDPAIAADWQHNAFGYEDAGLNKYQNKRNKTARLLYDVPEQPTSLAEINSSSRGSYWVREYMHTACMLEHADYIEWTPRDIPPTGIPPYDPNLLVVNVLRDRPPSMQERIDRGWSIMGQEWMRRYNGPHRQPPPADATAMPPPRYLPQAELALLRTRRRRRNAMRRRNIEEKRLGLAGMFA